MMANPIPPVLPAMNYECGEVKTQQPHSSPRPCPKYDIPSKDSEEGEKPEDALLKPPEPIAVHNQPMEEPPRYELGDLVPIERVSITRKLHVRKAISLRGKRNTFYVRTPDQNLVYTVEEENKWWVGYFCYGLRPMELKVLNAEGTEVIRIRRPYAFTTRILPCQLQRLQVFSPPGHLIGTVVQRWTAIRPLYFVKDILGRCIFEVHGPRITLSCFQDVQFHVKKPDGTLVATTNKRWEGLMHALFMAPVVDKFQMTFIEKDMVAEEKALLMAAALLLDYMYYDV